jgi:diguanylate cyclase (GGDEF)-like protein
LTSFGHEVFIAENGQVAVEKFQGLHPELVLMDIEMPVMNGFESTNKIREYETTQKWAWTPIIFLTASDTQENLITAIEAGGDDFLVKGLSAKVLQAKMKAMGRIVALRQKLTIANQQLEYQASRDGLTGLYNRRWMDSNVDLEWTDAINKHNPFALLMLDADNFKKYNDHYGHQAGDECLRSIARAAEKVIEEINGKHIPKNAFVARYGGEEFSVVIPSATVEIYEGAASRILVAIRELKIPHELNNDIGIVTVSIGGSRIESATGSAATLFREADAALYQAKIYGRNRVEYSKNK